MEDGTPPTRMPCSEAYLRIARTAVALGMSLNSQETLSGVGRPVARSSTLKATVYFTILQNLASPIGIEPIAKF